MNPFSLLDFHKVRHLVCNTSMVSLLGQYIPDGCVADFGLEVVRDLLEWLSSTFFGCINDLSFQTICDNLWTARAWSVFCRTCLLILFPNVGGGGFLKVCHPGCFT